MNFTLCVNRLFPCSRNVRHILKGDTFRIQRTIPLSMNSYSVYLDRPNTGEKCKVLNPGNSITSINRNNVLRSYSKKTKKREVKADSDDDSDDDLEEDLLDKLDKSSKIITHNLPSLRMDLVLKHGLALSRNKVDLAFYESKIRVNGKRVLKKNTHVSVGDEIDLIRGTTNVNPNLLQVLRIEVLSVKPDDEDESLVVKMRRFKNLKIENYEEYPYVESKSED